MNQKKILFIINPISGIGRKKVVEEIIRQHIDKSNFDFTIRYTEGAFHATELSREAARNNFDIVVAVGGDGSVNEAGKGLIGTRTSLGIIPAGSGNGLARHLKIPFSPLNALKVLEQGKSMLIDTVAVNNDTFLSIAGVGFDALVAKKYAKAGKRGFWSYFKIITKEYVRYKPQNYWLNIDGKSIKTKALLIAFANSSQFGYNTSIAPDAELQDGLVDVCIVQKIPILEVPFISNLLFLKQINRTKYVEIIKAKHIILERRKNRTINLDGEPVRVGKTLNIVVNPKSLSIIIP
jgi:YegS/Rv2252/BmrU family lipid kinase